MNCILAFKSYYEWKQAGGNGVWKYSENSIPTAAGKPIARGSSDQFLNVLTRNSSADSVLFDDLAHNPNEVVCTLNSSD